MDNVLQLLNDQHAIEGHLIFQAGPGNLATAVINNMHASAEITLAGGHVVAYTRHGEQPLLWCSPNAVHKLGRAMRGGVPVCWPWFGNHPTDPQGMPHHGFVRTMLWSFAGAQALPDGSTQVRMRVQDTAETRAVWPVHFELELFITVGRQLRVEWIAKNPGGQVYQYTGAFHPYFIVSDIRDISINGLDQVDYLDNTDGLRRKTQVGNIKFAGEVDRVFLDTTSEITIEDPGLNRTIRIVKEGSHTSVVWNPGDTDERMDDVGPGQHRKFVCVESANAFRDVIRVSPGEEKRLAMEMRIEQGAKS